MSETKRFHLIGSALAEAWYRSQENADADVMVVTTGDLPRMFGVRNSVDDMLDDDTVIAHVRAVTPRVVANTIDAEDATT